MVLQVQKRTYEAKTQEIAKQLLAATRENRSFFAQMRDQMRWDDKLLAWAMGNPGLRVQLFRFIDCLPSLGSKPEIAAHLQEYLGDESVLFSSHANTRTRSPSALVAGRIASRRFRDSDY